MSNYTSIIGTFNELQLNYIKTKLKNFHFDIQDHVNPTNSKTRVAFIDHRQRSLLITHLDKYVYQGAHVLDLDKESKNNKTDAFIYAATHLKIRGLTPGLLIQFTDENLSGEGSRQVFCIMDVGSYDVKGKAKSMGQFPTVEKEFDKRVDNFRILRIEEIIDFFNERKSVFNEFRSTINEILRNSIAEGIQRMESSIDAFQALGRLPREPRDFTNGGIVSKMAEVAHTPLTRERLLELRAAFLKAHDHLKFHRPAFIPAMPDIDYLSPFKFKVFNREIPDLPRMSDLLLHHLENPFSDFDIHPGFKKGYTSKFWFRADLRILKYLEEDLKGSGIEHPRVLFRNNELRDFVFMDGVIKELKNEVTKEALPQLADYDVDTLVAAMLIHESGQAVARSYINAEDLGECIIVEDNVTEIERTRVDPAMFLVRKLPASKGRELFLCAPTKAKTLNFLETIAYGKGKLIQPAPKVKTLTEELDSMGEAIHRILSLREPNVDFGTHVTKYEFHAYPSEDSSIRYKFKIPYTCKPLSRQGIGPFENAISDANSTLLNFIVDAMFSGLNVYLKAANRKVSNICIAQIQFFDEKDAAREVELTFDILVKNLPVEPQVIIRCETNVGSTSGKTMSGMVLDECKFIDTAKKAAPGKPVKVSDSQKSTLGKFPKPKREHDIDRVEELTIDAIRQLREGLRLDNEVIDEISDLFNDYSRDFGVQ